MSGASAQTYVLVSSRHARREAIATTSAILAGLIVAAWSDLALADLPAPPPLPSFPATTYNITVSNPTVGPLTASAGSSDNAAAIQQFINYVSTHGGGHVEIPAGTFLSSQITMKSNVDLKLDSGAILRDIKVGTTSPAFGTLLKCTSGTNMQISGSGIIDGAAATEADKTSNNLVDLRGVTTLAILGVSIQNSSHFHLVPSNDTNVTISGVTISDPGTLAANGGQYISNTDGIDYSGNNFLIKNCNISDGDDDIVAKPAGNAVSNIVITGCTIGAGHGISVGSGLAHGLTNLIVTDCTMNGTDNGIRFKAHDANDPNAATNPVDTGSQGGGTANPLKNVVFKNITMTNVAHPIIIDSFYDSGSSKYPTSPTTTTNIPYTYSSSTPLAPGSTTPIWTNVIYENITATGASDAGLIYGLNITTDGTTANAINGAAFSNVNISAGKHMDLWYGKNIDLSGLMITVPGSDAYANALPVHGARLYGLTNLTTGTPALVPGDFNRDGQFTIADMAAMQDALTRLGGFQSTGGLSDIQMDVLGDFNYDFKVTNADLQGLINQLANGGSGAFSAVPEPSAIWLVTIGMAGFAALQTRLRAGRACRV
jgi:polygalacturonase